MSLYFSNRYKLNDCIFGHQGQDKDKRSGFVYWDIKVKIRTQGQDWYRRSSLLIQKVKIVSRIGHRVKIRTQVQDLDTGSRLGHKFKIWTQGQD